MEMLMFHKINSAEDIWNTVQETGFLPLFRNEIDGFSIEDLTPAHLWFSDTEDGPWEWKGPVIRMGDCFYGKFFAGKAGYVSREWFPHFANYRRDGYDFDALYDDGLASRKDKTVYDTIVANGSMLTGDLKKMCNYVKGGNKGFDTVITRLQMETYVVVEDFVYATNRYGETYGWGIAKYSTPERLFGEDFFREAYRTKPSESREKVWEHLRTLFPGITEKQLQKILG